jgi:hypothetical protein
MLAAIIIILIILWFLGYVNIGNINIPDLQLFTINGHNISLWDLLILLVIAWAIGVLPSPLRQIAMVALVLWILATLGILAITGLPSIIIIALILGLIFFLLGG